MRNKIEERFKLLEDKIHHVSESTEFLAKQMLRMKNQPMFPKYRIGTIVYIYNTYPHYEKCEIIEISYNDNGKYPSADNGQYHYLLKPIDNTLYKTDEFERKTKYTSWYSENGIYETLQGIKDFLHKQIEEYYQER